MNKNLKIILFLIAAAFVVIAVAIVLLPEQKIESTPTLITENELPEGYIVQVKMGYHNEIDSNDMVRISRGPYRLGIGQSYADDEVEIKFCGFSESGEIYLSVNNGNVIEISGSAAIIPNSNYYISYQSLDKKYIDIRWSMDLQKGESVPLSSGQNLTFVEFVDSTAMFKLE